MKKNLIKLLVATSLSNFAYAETTNNLVSTDFSSGWTNTGNSYHGSSTIAGHHGGTVESDSVSLNTEGINKESLNEGFSVTGSANVWFWNNYSQSVTQTIKAVDDNGQTITQNRTISGTCATWNGCGYGSMTDTLIIGSNSQQDYDVNLKYSFSVPNQTSGHYGADLKDPSLSVTYTYVPPLDSATQTALLDLNNDIKDELKDVDTFEFKNEDIKVDNFESFSEEPTFDDFKEDDFSMDTGLVDSKEETLELEPKEESLDDQDSTFTESAEPSDEKTDDQMAQTEEPTQSDEAPSNDQTDSQESQISETDDTGTSDNQEDKAESSSSQDASDKAGKSSGDVKDSSKVSLAKSMEKIDQQVKDIGENLRLKNLVKIKLMTDNSALESYANVEFYKPKNIYLDQASITDNRVLYANASLVSYQQKDPLFQAQKELFDIRQEKQKLIREIQVLKNVR